MQFHLLPIRDWNILFMIIAVHKFLELQFHLLPIRDWNKKFSVFKWDVKKLQFHLLPIRDWNKGILRSTYV